jgi:dihydroxyacid dehydratase/phosphogluconate dehydratase
LGRDVPTLVDLMPSGRFLMEDFYYAGGLPAVIRALDQRKLIHRGALTVNGKTIWENCQTASNWNPEVIRSPDNALTAHRGIAVLRGNDACIVGNPGLCLRAGAGWVSGSGSGALEISAGRGFEWSRTGKL